MATYLQGVTDYIPDYQPFQPDLNFYNNVLQTKQTQYDTNWKSVNNLYAELHNADLTHDQNVKKKDQLLTQIDFNLKRVTGLDLSLEQNVDQATQVFRPFYEDKYLMKDMAYTKNYNGTLSRALNLKNSQDEKMQKQYWDLGIKEMQYRKQEFKDATLDETLNMGNVTYTPYVDALAKYKQIAKDSGISIDIKDVDETGMYFIHEKNGKRLTATMQNLFLSTYANDPALQARYGAEAYVKRKSYAEQNATKFNGNKSEAEKEYLRDQYTFLQNYTAKQNSKNQEKAAITTNKVTSSANALEKRDANPYTESYLESLNKALDIDQTVANHSEKLNETFNANNDREATDNGANQSALDLNNLELARLKVDSGTASLLAEQHILMAADNAAMVDYKYEKTVNPIGLENLNHKHSLERISYNHTLRQQDIILKAQTDRETKRIEKGLEDGTMFYDAKGKLYEDPGSTYNTTLGSPSGQFTDEVNKIKDNIDKSNKVTSDLTGTYIANTLTTMRVLTSGNKPELSQQEVWNALSFLDPNSKEAASRYGTKNGYEMLNKLLKKYEADPNKFIINFSKTGQVIKLKKFMDKWSNDNFGHDLAVQYKSDKSGKDVEKYVRFKEQADIVDKTNYDILSKDLTGAIDQMGLKLKPESKQKIVDLYIKKVRTGQEFSDDDFADFVDENLNYAKTPVTKVDKEFETLLGKDGNAKYNSMMTKERQKWQDKNFWKSEEGKKIATSKAGAANAFQERMDRVASEYIYNNMSDAEYKKILAKQVWSNNEGWKRKQEQENRGPLKEGNRNQVDYSKKLMKSPYEYTAAELKESKRRYVQGLNKLNKGQAPLNSGAFGRKGFSEQTGIDMDDLYSNLSKSYLKAVNRTGDGSLMSYSGYVRTNDGRFSLGSNQVTAKDVNLANPAWGGFRDFQEIMADINRISFSQDSSKYAVTIGGLTKNAAEDNALDAAEAKALLRELQLSAAGKKTKTGKFTIARSPIAMEDQNLAAMIVVPPQDFLAKYIKDDEGKPDWAKIKLIRQNGISFIAPKNQWTNNFYLQNEFTPTEQILNAKGKIEYTHGNKAGEYIIEKVKSVPGVDYSIKTVFNDLLPDGTINSVPKYTPFKKFGNNIDDNEASVYDRLQLQNEHNLKVYAEMQRRGDVAAIKKAQEFFRNPSYMSYKY
jgi:hypothetical protein